MSSHLDIPASKRSGARQSSHSREIGVCAPGRLLRTICASLYIPSAADRYRVAARVGEDQTQIRHVCVGSMKATQSVACGERIQVLVEDEDGDAIWAAARVARMDADGRFTVEVTEWEESDGASYEDGPFRMNDEGTVWRRIIP